MHLDKTALYGQFLASATRREKLADLATRKALDLPADDEMNITTTHHSGLEFRHLAGIGALLLGSGIVGGGGTLGLASLLGWFNKSPPPAATSQAPLAAQQYRVTFWTADGKPIEAGAETPAPEKQ